MDKASVIAIYAYSQKAVGPQAKIRIYHRVDQYCQKSVLAMISQAHIHRRCVGLEFQNNVPRERIIYHKEKGDCIAFHVPSLVKTIFQKNITF